MVWSVMPTHTRSAHNSTLDSRFCVPVAVAVVLRSQVTMARMNRQCSQDYKHLNNHFRRAYPDIPPVLDSIFRPVEQVRGTVKQWDLGHLPGMHRLINTASVVVGSGRVVGRGLFRVEAPGGSEAKQSTL
jgi:hypothetical protein